jgi:hypothetical protein
VPIMDSSSYVIGFFGVRISARFSCSLYLNRWKFVRFISGNLVRISARSESMFYLR